jgi:hypothetical protein
MAVQVAPQQPGLLEQTKFGFEDVERFDNFGKWADAGSKMFEALFEAIEWGPAHAFGKLGKGINFARKFVEGGKVPSDINKLVAAVENRDFKSPEYRVVDAARHTAWFGAHTMSTVNLMSTIGAVSYGSAGHIIGQVAPGCALVGFACNIGASLVEMRRIHREMQRPDLTPQQYDKLESEQRDKIIDVIKDLLILMGLFAITFLAWKCQKKYHISRATGYGLQFASASIGLIRTYDKIRDKMEKQRKAAAETPALAGGGSASAPVGPRPSSDTDPRYHRSPTTV